MGRFLIESYINFKEPLTPSEVDLKFL